MDFPMGLHKLAVEFKGIHYTFGHYFKGFQSTPLHDSLFVIYKPNNNTGLSKVLLFLDLEKASWENQSLQIILGEGDETEEYTLPVEVLRKLISIVYSLYQEKYAEAMLLRTHHKVSNGKLPGNSLEEIYKFLEKYNDG